ncbi:transcriptional regulator, TetR family [Terribacillus aidingensis]|uniref:Transcriptional regulator, TetR family n=1 Tax=Terribacillus aidingensis TaxID=586416 RepID=A0A285NLP4_9BACI|nr:TetR/AcrR family transcriptional regulator [Terribacillus aidingensis]SNZ10158.1 transcriptional regulator, TetR family [Terribacillus aidingensis]
MRGEDKRELILKSAIKVISEKGISNFSISNICEIANISKGGFMYHFPSKEALLQSLHEFIIKFVKDLVDEELKVRNSYTEAYIYASYTVSKSEEIKAYTSLLNYETEAKELLAVWNNFYIEVLNNLSQELSPEWVSFVDIMVEGLWMKGAYYNDHNLMPAIELLTKLIKMKE